VWEDGPSVLEPVGGLFGGGGEEVAGEREESVHVVFC